MGKYDVDFEDYDSSKSGGYSGDEPKNGIYDGVLVSCREHTTTDDALEWQFDITEGDYKGWRGWVYSNMSSTKWRTQEIVAAIQGEESKMSLDPAGEGEDGTKTKVVKKALPVRLRIKGENYEGERRAKIRNVLPHPEASEKKVSKKKKKKGDDPF